MMDDIASSCAYDYGGRSARSAAACHEEGGGYPSNGKSSSFASRYSDRLIPSRTASNLESGFGLMLDENACPPSTAGGNNSGGNGVPESNVGGDSRGNAYHHLLRTEILGAQPPGIPREQSDGQAPRTPETGNLFRYKRNCLAATQHDAFLLSPVPFRNSDLLGTPCRAPRKIPKVPFKVLDAPALQDDFYLNLVDWSSTNVLSVGLSNCVYLWSACTSRVMKLCELSSDDMVTSVSWTGRGAHLAVGTNKGEVQIWDSSAGRKLRSMSGHRNRIGTMAWNGYVLSTGSRDHSILHRDVRQQAHFMSRLQGHRQEVCGLKWSYDEQQLASGGNDNKLCVWNLRSSTPVLKFNEHQAAVKAIAWSPHQRGLLASGGGTADRCIRFWNTVNNSALSCVDTGSQVCNLIWSKNVNEIVSTHGYSLNQIVVWKYPAMSEVITLTGHTYRVLYLAISPDGQTVVTGAGDETLRFWQVFPGSKSTSGSGVSSSMMPLGQIIR